MKKVCLLFDLEGNHGMPSPTGYDIAMSLKLILSILKKYDVRSTFFVLGKLVEEQPKLIEAIASDGHSIALHGYAHEHYDLYTEGQLTQLSHDLARVENILITLTGKRPIGFRSPFLMSPAFHSPRLYALLRDRGYLWVCNRSIRHEREFLRPRSFFPRALLKSKLVRISLFMLLNWRFICNDTTDSRSRVPIFANSRWLLTGMPPFLRNGIIEIPAQVPFDCDLVGLPRSEESTSQILLDYAVDTMVSSVLEAKGDYNLTFHDWIVGCSNRSQMLKLVLSKLVDSRKVEFATPDELI